MSERTHDPTPKRLRDARAKGDVPQAPLVAGALGLVIAIPLLRGIVEARTRDLARALSSLEPVRTIDAWSVAFAVIGAVAPLALVLAAIALASGIVLGSVGFSPARLAPDPSKLEPFSGIKRIFEKGRLWGAARGLAVLALASAVVWKSVLFATANGARAAGDPGKVLRIAADAASSIAMTAGAIACVFAVADALIGRRIWLGRLKMTREEVMREHKEGEGDPDIKRRREELHHELLAAEAVTAVRDASVIVINPTHLACALRYRGDDDDDAPTLIAKGHGALAERIVAAARLHGVPVIRDVPVARALIELELGTEIPEALYEAVAEVLRAAWDGEGD